MAKEVPESKTLMRDFTIRENPKARDALLGRAREVLGRRREGIHVTDLLFPRRTYFRARHPELALTDEEVGLFAAGRGHHHILEILAASPEYREVEVELEGVKGRVDVLEEFPKRCSRCGAEL